MLAELKCFCLEFRKSKSKNLIMHVVPERGEMLGGQKGALLWIGMEKHQEFTPTSTCSHFELNRYLVL